jgi:hypothetical protein
LHAWVPYLAYLRGDIPLQLEAIASTVGSTHLAAAEFQRELEKTREELEEYVAAQRASIDKALEGAREASAREGVGHFAQVFSQEAEGRSGDARKWLAASFAAVIVTIAAAVVFLLVALPSAPAQAVQYATSKVIVLAMLIGVTTWCAGNYKANMHQSVVSRRKAHALKTFQAFVEASDNPAVRDAVLLETTRSIFSQAQTGYLKSDGTADSPSQIVEIIKTSDGGQK